MSVLTPDLDSTFLGEADLDQTGAWTKNDKALSDIVILYAEEKNNNDGFLPPRTNIKIHDSVIKKLVITYHSFKVNVSTIQSCVKRNSYTVTKLNIPKTVVKVKMEVKVKLKCGECCANAAKWARSCLADIPMVVRVLC